MTPQQPGQTPHSAALDQLLSSRFSCRGFRPDPVPRVTIERILAIAQRTASWCNTQPWRLIISSGDALERFGTAITDWARQGAPVVSDLPFPSAYEGVYQARRRECGLQLYESVGVRLGDRTASAAQALENFRFFGAAHMALVTTDRALGVYGAVDCGAYVSNFTLAARSLGVATIAQAAFAHHADFVRDYFGLPQDRLVLCGISFGYEDPDHPANRFRTTRAAIEDVATFLDD